MKKPVLIMLAVLVGICIEYIVRVKISIYPALIIAMLTIMLFKDEIESFSISKWRLDQTMRKLQRTKNKVDKQIFDLDLELSILELKPMYSQNQREKMSIEFRMKTLIRLKNRISKAQKDISKINLPS